MGCTVTDVPVTSSLDLVAVLDTLRRKRPIFSSEADFQVAVSWEIQIAHPDARIRMEYRPAYLDRRGYLRLGHVSRARAAARGGSTRAVPWSPPRPWTHGSPANPASLDCNETDAGTS